MSESAVLNPSGLCQCGCGDPAPIAKRTTGRLGHVRGQAVRFIPGHQFRRFLRSTEDRILDRIVQSDTDCWVWQGPRTGPKREYGTISHGVQMGVHRAAYEVWRGPIPDELEIDHLCETKLCVNPYHLEAVTHAENMRRMGERRRARR